MSAKIQAILAAKESAGEDAYLWLQSDVGDCILWPSEEHSIDDNGSKAVGRWTLTPAEVTELESATEIDGLN